MSESKLTRLLVQTLSTQETDGLLKNAAYQRFLTQLTQQQLSEIDQYYHQTLLQKESQRITKLMVDLCLSEYKSFAILAETEKLVNEKYLKEIRELLEGSSDYSSLERSVTKFENTVKTEVDDLRTLTSLANGYDKIAEFLDVPQLLKSLIEQEHYDEALTLYDHIRHVDSTAGSVMPDRKPELISIICKRCKDLVEGPMLQKLIESLKKSSLSSSANQLHLSLKTIGYLRRMKMFSSEVDLHVLFLQVRSEFYNERTNELFASPNNTSNTAQATEVVDTLKSFIEMTRACFIDVIIQYQAIFTDSFSGTSSSATSAFILSSYLNEMFSRFIETVENNLSFVKDSSQLLNLHSQVMHLGVSLARKGFDFRYLVSDLFERNIESLFKGMVDEATNSLIYELKELGLRIPENLKPDDITSFPLFAYVANQYLQAFNALRVMLVADAMLPCYKSLIMSLENAVENVNLYSVKYQIPDESSQKLKIYTRTWTKFLLENYTTGLFQGMDQFLEVKKPDLKPDVLMERLIPI